MQLGAPRNWNFRWYSHEVPDRYEPVSPRVRGLLFEGCGAVHWSAVGEATASDREIMQWARDNHRVVLTHDLDFGAILAATRTDGPSVAQIRAGDVRPEAMAPALVSVLRQYEGELNAGALLIVNEATSRVRLLPLSNR
jgi:predicted nuclease of predicted toxin-antitoxin system